MSELIRRSGKLQAEYYSPGGAELRNRLSSGLIRNASLLNYPGWDPDEFAEGMASSERAGLLAGTDCLIYALSILSTFDIDADKLMFLIESRQNMVHHMHESCRAIRDMGKEKRSIVVMDIDGVIFPYPDVRSDFCRDCGVDDYEQAKELYRLSGIKAVMPPIDGAKELMSLWQEQGKSVVVVSSRPVDLYPEVYTYTRSFFDLFDMRPDLLLFKANKHVSAELGSLWPLVEYFVDDEVHRLEDMKALHPHIGCIHITPDPAVSDTEMMRFSTTRELYDYFHRQTAG